MWSNFTKTSPYKVGCVVMLGAGLFFVVLWTQYRSPSEQICQNLVNAKLRESALCYKGNNQYEYIPFYFPVGKVSLNFVMTGMSEFEQVDFSKNLGNVCSNGKTGTITIYKIANNTHVRFRFCNMILSDIFFYD